MIEQTAKLKNYEHFEHESDMGVRGFGANPTDAFEQAACALTAVTCDLDLVEAVVPVEINCNSPNIQMLLVDWLNCLVSEGESRKMIFSQFDIHQLEKTFLRATVWGEPINTNKHRPAVDVKGATYTCLKVEKMEDGRWIAQCVVDI